VRQRGIRLGETPELRNCTEPQASCEGRRAVQSSDGVEWVALREWGGCWGSGARVPRASPLTPTGSGVGESFLHSTVQVFQSALALLGILDLSIYCANTLDKLQ